MQIRIEVKRPINRRILHKRRCLDSHDQRLKEDRDLELRHTSRECKDPDRVRAEKR